MVRINKFWNSILFSTKGWVNKSEVDYEAKIYLQVRGHQELKACWCVFVMYVRLIMPLKCIEEFIYLQFTAQVLFTHILVYSAVVQIIYMKNKEGKENIRR